jgi:hypothetical protein
MSLIPPTVQGGMVQALVAQVALLSDESGAQEHLDAAVAAVAAVLVAATAAAVALQNDALLQVHSVSQNLLNV